MSWKQIIWDHMPRGNVEHVAEHDLSTSDVEHVLENFTSAGVSESSGRPCVFGYTSDDRYIIVVFEEIDEETVMPVSAYDVDEPA